MTPTALPAEKRVIMAAASRPFGVTLVAIIAWITGAIQIINGVVALVGGGSVSQSWAPIAAIGFGVLIILVSLGLFRGNSVARVMVAIVFVMNIVLGVLAAAQGLVGWWSVIWSALLPVIGLVLLFSAKANRFFR